ncbi:MAG: hypothetical protein K1X78_01295 [Verrucomicrobiaceae bacterium]|nr:hypothetical protein [Verrucomicrobiaceae bacterium]
MKSTLLTLAVTMLLTLTAAASEALPFGVTLGGQAAKDGSPFASIEKPVANNAELVVAGKADIIIVNVTPADAKGNPKEGATPVVILLQGTSKTTLDKTLDGQKLAAGKYAMNVTMDGKTALLTFAIQ